MDEKELMERKVAREILTMIETICFSKEYNKLRVDNGSNVTRNLIMKTIKEQYLN